MASNKSLLNNTEKRAPSVLERTSFLEQKLFREIYPEVKEHKRQLLSADKILGAIIEIIGDEAISTKIVEIRAREVEAEVQAQEEAFTEAVAKGELAVVQSSQKTDLLIAASQTNAEGKQVGPRKVFAPITGYESDAAAALGFDREAGVLSRELKVGDSVEVKSGDTLKCRLNIVGLYEPVVQAATEPTSSETAGA